MKKYILQIIAIFVVFSISYAQTDKKVRDMTKSTTPTNTDGVYVVKSIETSPTDSYMLLSDLKTYMGGSSSSSGADVKLISSYSNNLTTAISSIGSTKTVLVIDSAITLTGNVTVPETIDLKISRGGSIALGSYNLILNGNLDAGNYQIFSGNGRIIYGTLGNAAYKAARTPIVNVLWRGADPSWGNASTNTAAIQATIDDAEASVTDASHGCVVYVPAGSYPVNSGLTIQKSYVSLIGDGLGTVFFPTGTNYNLVTVDSGAVDGNGVKISLRGNEVRDFQVYYAASPGTTGTCIVLNDVQAAIVERLNLTSCYSGVLQHGGMNNRFMNLDIQHDSAIMGADHKSGSYGIKSEPGSIAWNPTEYGPTLSFFSKIEIGGGDCQKVNNVCVANTGDTMQYGIWISGGDTVDVTDSHYFRTYGANVYINPTSGYQLAVVNFTNAYCDGNTTNITAHGVQIAGTGTAQAVAFINPFMDINSLYASSNSTGFLASATVDNLKIIGGTISGSNQWGIYLGPNVTNAFIANNDIHFNGYTTSLTDSAGIYVNQSKYFTISNNIIGRASVENQKYGIYCVPGVNYYTIIGNVLVGNITGQITIPTPGAKSNTTNNVY